MENIIDHAVRLNEKQLGIRLRKISGVALRRDDETTEQPRVPVSKQQIQSNRNHIRLSSERTLPVRDDEQTANRKSTYLCLESNV